MRPSPRSAGLGNRKKAGIGPAMIWARWNVRARSLRSTRCSFADIPSPAHHRPAQHPLRVEALTDCPHNHPWTHPILLPAYNCRQLYPPHLLRCPPRLHCHALQITASQTDSAGDHLRNQWQDSEAAGKVLAPSALSVPGNLWAWRGRRTSHPQSPASLRCR